MMTRDGDATVTQSTNVLPRQLDRVTCTKCFISSPKSLMLIGSDNAGPFVWCRNAAACRKRQRKRAPKNAGPIERNAEQAATAAAKSKRKREKTTP